MRFAVFEWRFRRAATAAASTATAAVPDPVPDADLNDAPAAADNAATGTSSGKRKRPAKAPKPNAPKAGYDAGGYYLEWARLCIKHDPRHWMATFSLMAHSKDSALFSYFCSAVGQAIYKIYDDDRKLWKQHLIDLKYTPKQIRKLGKRYFRKRWAGAPPLDPRATPPRPRLGHGLRLI